MDWATIIQYSGMILTGLVYLLAIRNFLNIINRNINPPTAFAWILVNFLMPYVGVPLYYFFGENRLRSYVRRREKRRSTSYTKTIAHAADDEAALLPLDPFERVFTNLGESNRRHPGSVALLVDGQATFESIFAAIEGARHYVLVQYYIIRPDRIGMTLKELLIRKARAGVKVYLLYDYIGSLWLSQTYVRDLKSAGVAVARFLPFRFHRKSPANFRNHRKLVLVDGVVAFTGGLNVGDEYLSLGSDQSSYWRDSHLKVEGRPVESLQRIFQDDWFFAARDKTRRSVMHLTPVRTTDEPRAEGHRALVQVVPFGPNDKVFVGLLLFMQAIQTAQKRLWIATPYFIPDGTLERLLELAILRGVDVRLIMPGIADHPLVHWVSLSYAIQLREKGLKVYLYHKGFMHQKFIIIDDEITLAGTSNFDNRTVYLNFETAILITSASFNRQVTTMLEEDMRHARPLDGPAQHGRWYVFRARLARLLAPLL